MTALRMTAAEARMNRRIAGFTLIELMVALLLLALMSSILYGSLSLSATSWDRGEAKAEQAGDMRQTGRIPAPGARRRASAAPAQGGRSAAGFRRRQRLAGVRRGDAGKSRRRHLLFPYRACAERRFLEAAVVAHDSRLQRAQSADVRRRRRVGARRRHRAAQIFVFRPRSPMRTMRSSRPGAIAGTIRRSCRC